MSRYNNIRKDMKWTKPKPSKEHCPLVKGKCMEEKCVSYYKDNIQEYCRFYRHYFIGKPQDQ